MAYTDLCIRNSGSNLNSGTRTGNTTVPGTAADITYLLGSLVSATGVFTVASGDPVADGVATGDFAAVCATGATVAALIGKITARTSTTITISTTIKMGTMPADGTGNRELRIGGALAGPSGTVQFPFDILNKALVAATGDVLCINVKSDVTASMTAGISCSPTGVIEVRGFGTSYRDKAGYWTISGATTGASYVPLTIGGVQMTWSDMDVINNGASGTSAGILINGGRIRMERVSVATVRGSGFSSNTTIDFVECEAAGVNQSNTANLGGFEVTGASVFHACYAHDNAGSNNNGIVLGGSTTYSLIECILDTNGAAGVAIQAGGNFTITGCDFYANVNGLRITAACIVDVENSNFVDNTTTGVLQSSQAATTLHKCGFPAAGTTANATDTSFSSGVITNESPITITANTTPYNDPSTGDFRITAASNLSAGRGDFTQRKNSKAGSVAYPAVGAVQGAAGSGSGGVPSIGANGPLLRGAAQ